MQISSPKFLQKQEFVKSESTHTLLGTVRRVERDTVSLSLLSSSIKQRSLSSLSPLTFFCLVLCVPDRVNGSSDHPKSRLSLLFCCNQINDSSNQERILLLPGLLYRHSLQFGSSVRVSLCTYWVSQKDSRESLRR